MAGNKMAWTKKLFPQVFCMKNFYFTADSLEVEPKMGILVWEIYMKSRGSRIGYEKKKNGMDLVWSLQDLWA